MNIRRMGCVLMLSTVLATAQALEPEVAPADLAFKDIRYLSRSLEDFGEQEAYVFAFTQLAAPCHDALTKALTKLQKDVDGQAVSIALVNAGSDDSILEIAHDGILRDLSYTLLKDTAGGSASLGVRTAGTVVLLDKDRKLRYRGNSGGLHDALIAVLAGKTVETPETEVIGEGLAPAPLPPASKPITYSEHIAPIMDRHCVTCHRPNQGTPFSLRRYKQVAARADMIAEVVLEERMPPWYGVRSHGPFANERKVSDAEKITLRQWLAAGTPEGDPALRPEPPVFPDTEWAIGEPDLVITAAEEEQIPADGYIPYRYVTLPYQFSADTWVQGLEILPGNTDVVHHANLIYTQVGDGYSEDYNFLTGRVPGGDPVDLPDNVGMLIPKDSVLTLQIHYVTTGKPARDRIRVGIRYARSTIVKRTHHQRMRPESISIPPGDPFFPIRAEETIDYNATVLALFTHMHLRGRDMTFFADYPDGTSETLLTVPNYSFDWQLAYVYEPGTKRFPKGTKIRTQSHYDNSAFNPYNPDPTVEVNYGDQTYHEMNDGYIFFLDEEESLNIQVDPKTGHVLAAAK